jgi:hypothetical protein
VQGWDGSENYYYRYEEKYKVNSIFKKVIAGRIHFQLASRSSKKTAYQKP